MDLKVCDGLYIRPFKYYPTAEEGVYEFRYQVIFDGSEAGNKHIVSSCGIYTTEEAASEYCDSLMREPQWKHNLEVRFISERLRGYTVQYQLDNFDKLFADWSSYEKELARKILTGQFNKKRDRAESSLDSKIADAKAQRVDGKEDNRGARDYERD